MSSTELARHDRVWLDAAGWRTLRIEPAQDDDRLDAWIAAGRALVVRRRDPAMPADAVGLGVALPLAQGRARIGLVVDRRAIVKSAPPLTLAQVIAYASGDVRDALADLDARGTALDTRFSVYGSHAWQAISGEACVTPTSDLDLLWDARDADQVARVLDLLDCWERAHALRADGEVRFADGGAVAWRELARARGRVLVKRAAGVSLEPLPMVLA